MKKMKKSKAIKKKDKKWEVINKKLERKAQQVKGKLQLFTLFITQKSNKCPQQHDQYHTNVWKKG